MPFPEAISSSYLIQVMIFQRKSYDSIPNIPKMFKYVFWFLLFFNGGFLTGGGGGATAPRPPPPLATAMLATFSDFYSSSKHNPKRLRGINSDWGFLPTFCFRSQQWSCSSFSWSLTSNITSHNISYTQSERWLLEVPILTTSRTHLSLKCWENVLSELGSELDSSILLEATSVQVAAFPTSTVELDTSDQFKISPAASP